MKNVATAAAFPGMGMPAGGPGESLTARPTPVAPLVTRIGAMRQRLRRMSVSVE